jgi:hypothetical protein
VVVWALAWVLNRKKDNVEQKTKPETKHKAKHETRAEGFANERLVTKASASFIGCSVFGLKEWLNLRCDTTEIL